MKKLTTVALSKIQKPGRYAVGDGAYLQITGHNGRSWIFRFQRDGRARHVGLGSTELVSLAEARAKASGYRKLLLEGIDPIESRDAARQRARLESARAVTFRECAERYVASHEAAWRNEVHRKQWSSTLATYVYPILGVLPVHAVDTALVTEVLEPIWATKPETAGRVRGRIESVLDWAKARGYRDGENPARWRGHLDKLLPNRRKVRRPKHHAALPYADLPAFMEELRARESISARSLEFTILTAARTGETIGATLDEINFAEKTWTVPASRMKACQEHRVPLCDRALEILRSLPQEKGNPFLFVGGRSGRALSNMAMLELLRGMVQSDVTVHGFRSTFRDWAAERTNHPNHVVEMALAHAISGDVEAAYRRGDLFEKRRRLMKDWTNYCAQSARPIATVLELREARP
jgi:integrase